MCHIFYLSSGPGAYFSRIFKLLTNRFDGLLQFWRWFMHPTSLPISTKGSKRRGINYKIFKIRSTLRELCKLWVAANEAKTFNGALMTGKFLHSTRREDSGGWLQGAKGSSSRNNVATSLVVLEPQPLFHLFPRHAKFKFLISEFYVVQTINIYEDRARRRQMGWLFVPHALSNRIIFRFGLDWAKSIIFNFDCKLLNKVLLGMVA